MKAKRKIAPTIRETLGKPVARLPRPRIGDVREAHRQHEPPAVAGLRGTARTPAAWPSGLVVLAVADVCSCHGSPSTSATGGGGPPTLGWSSYSRPRCVLAGHRPGVGQRLAQVMTLRSSS